MLKGHDLDARHVELGTDLVIRTSTGPAARPSQLTEV
jgi:LacI family transcriptional regulator